MVTSLKNIQKISHSSKPVRSPRPPGVTPPVAEIICYLFGCTSSRAPFSACARRVRLHRLHFSDASVPDLPRRCSPHAHSPSWLCWRCLPCSSRSSSRSMPGWRLTTGEALAAARRTSAPAAGRRAHPPPRRRTVPRVIPPRVRRMRASKLTPVVPRAVTPKWGSPMKEARLTSPARR